MANGEVGALHVSLGLDSKVFSQRMQDIDRKLKAVDSEFKVAAASSDIFDDSMESLQARSANLTRKLELQSAKANELKSEYDQLVASGNANEKQLESMIIKYNNAVAAMNRTQKTLGEVNTKIGKQESKWDSLKTKLDSVSAKFQEVGEKMKGVGKGMATSITAPLTGLGLAAGKMASDFETAQGRLQAQLGLTAEESEKLGGIAKKMWANAFGENLTEVTDALATVKQNIQGLNDVDLQSVTEKAFILRDAFGAEISESTRTASVMMKNFGIDATTAFDLMTVGFQKGGNFSDELLDTMREYSPQFATMGHSAQEMMNILIAGAEAGAFNLDKVGDAVKEFNIRAKDGSKTTAEGFKAIGLDAEKMGAAIASGGDAGSKAFQATIAALAAMEDPVKRNAAGVALFGTQWEDLETDVIAAMATTEDKLGVVEGATTTAGEAMYNTFGSRLTSAIRDLGVALEPLGMVLLDMAEKVLPPLTEFVAILSEKFAALSPTMQTITVIFGMIAAAVGPVLIVFGMIAQAIGALIPVFTAIGTFITTILVPAFAAVTAPVWAIVAAIVAAIAIGVLLWKNWDVVKEKTIEIWNIIKDFITKWWKEILAIITGPIGIIVYLITQNWDTIKAITSKVWDSIKDFFVKWWDELLALITGPIGILVFLIANNWDTIKSTTSKVWEAIKAFFISWWPALLAVITGPIGMIVYLIASNWDSIKSKTSQVWNSIKTTVSEIVTNIISVVKEKFESIKTAVSEKMTAAKDKISEIWDLVMTFFGEIDLYNTGKNIIQGLIDGISAMGNKLIEKAKDIAESIKDTLTGILDIHSPSRETLWMGQMVGEGFIKGMNQSISQIAKTAGKMASAVLPDIQDIQAAGYSPFGQSIKSPAAAPSYGDIHISISAKDVQEFNSVVDIFRYLKQNVKAK